MMILNARKNQGTNIGVMELGNITFDEDNIQLTVDILNMSEEIKEKISNAIEMEKKVYSEDWERHYRKNRTKKSRRRNLKWSDKPVIIEGNYLNIDLEAGKPIKCTIDTAFHDAVNDYLEPVSSFEIDLSAHLEELKKEIIKALVDQFF